MPAKQHTRHVATARCAAPEVWEALLAFLMVILIERDNPQGGKRPPFIRAFVDARTHELVVYIYLNSTTGGLRTRLLEAGIVLTDLRAGEDLSDAGPLQVALTQGEHQVAPVDLTDKVRSDLARKIAAEMPTADPGCLLARVESCRRYKYAEGTYFECGKPCKRSGRCTSSGRFFPDLLLEDNVPPADPDDQRSYEGEGETLPNAAAGGGSSGRKPSKRAMRRPLEPAYEQDLERQLKQQKLLREFLDLKIANTRKHKLLQQELAAFQRQQAQEDILDDLMIMTPEAHELDRNVGNDAGYIAEQDMAGNLDADEVDAGEDLSDAGPLQVSLAQGEHQVAPVDVTFQVRSDLARKIAAEMPTADPGYLLAMVESCRRYEYAEGTYFECGKACKRSGRGTSSGRFFAEDKVPPADPAAAFQELFDFPMSSMYESVTADSTNSHSGSEK